MTPITNSLVSDTCLACAAVGIAGQIAMREPSPAGSRRLSAVAPCRHRSVQRKENSGPCCAAAALRRVAAGVRSNVFTVTLRRTLGIGHRRCHLRHPLAAWITPADDVLGRTPGTPMRPGRAPSWSPAPGSWAAQQYPDVARHKAGKILLVFNYKNRVATNTGASASDLRADPGLPKEWIMFIGLAIVIVVLAVFLTLRRRRRM